MPTPKKPTAPQNDLENSQIQENPDTLTSKDVMVHLPSGHDLILNADTLPPCFADYQAHLKEIVQDQEVLRSEAAILRNLEPFSTRHDGGVSFTATNGLVTMLNLQTDSPKAITEHVTKLIGLHTFHFTSEHLTSLPKSVGFIPTLKWLTLDIPHLAELPRSLRNLPFLKVLSVLSDRFTIIPEIICQLPQLKMLMFGKNLETLPPSLGTMASLGQLLLANNRLTTLPDNLGQLSSLQFLDLSNNSLSTLPQSIGTLRNLECLILFHNHLTQLPDSISGLTGLKIANLSQNNLQPLPPSFGLLPRLEYLMVDSNVLLSSHLILGQCASLKIVMSYDAPWQLIPKRIGHLQLLASVMQNGRLTPIPPSDHGLVFYLAPDLIAATQTGHMEVIQRLLDSYTRLMFPYNYNL